MKKFLQTDLLACPGYKELQQQINDTLASYAAIFPPRYSSRILLKPNLNSNMNALTGNTTDLRLLAVVIQFFKDWGYTNITIGEGTNSGFYRSGISVISRLKIDTLAAYFGVGCIDLNRSEAVPITFENGVQAGVARDCLEADLFINMPKLKTHFEAGMSICLKNLIGCLVGQENKKKTHLALAANIVHITENIRPHLHIVDALFAMEGLGPTKGTPVKTDTVLIGTDPYLVDLLAARFAGFDYRKVTTLVVAEQRGLIDYRSHEYVDNFPLEPATVSFAPPKAGRIATFIHSPTRQKYFLAIRHTRLFTYLCSTKLAGKLLYLTDLRQDVFIDDEMVLERMVFANEQCTDCGRCRNYCPVALDLPKMLAEEDLAGCISCLYCFCVCPEHAIGIEGELGFFQEQLKQYDQIIRRIA
jgi:uncharacterized protein (DUF362 family)/ferredoxin